MAFFEDAIAAIHASPSLADVAIFDLTGVPQSEKPASLETDFANLHPYPQLGRQPFTVLANAIAQRVEAGKDVVITETGYHTGSADAAWEAVDELTQAKLTLNLLVDAARLGVASTYLYDLADKADPTGTSVDANMGLFDQSLQPKAAATAIHNLTAILADSTPAESGPTSDPLDYSLYGLPRTGASLLIEKSGGEHALLVWAEPDIWNENTDRAIKPPVSHVHVTLGGVFDVNVYDPLLSEQPIATYRSVAELDIDVVDHPVVVEVVAAGALGEVGGGGGPAALTLTGTGGANSLIGLAGDDVLSGLAGNDILRAGHGDDTLIGGMGIDKLYGGSGADVFLFKAAAESTLLKLDQIFDFSVPEGDKIDLSRIDAMTTVVGNQAFILGGSSFSGISGELIQVREGAGVLLLGDTNGDGQADFAAMLSGLTTPVATDAIFL